MGRIIDVSVDNNCHYSYSDDPALCKRAEVVQWRCNDGDLTIDFPNGNPFDPRTPPPYRASKGTPTQPPALVLNRLSTEGAWKYNVTVVRDGKPCRTDDPTVIIDNTSVVHPFAALGELAESTRNVLATVFSDLRGAVPAAQDAPKFFPDGIDLIDFELSLDPPRIMVKVTGPKSGGGFK